MNVKKVTNVGIRAGAMIIPAIRAVLSDYEGTHTAAEMKDIYLQVYETAKGCVTAIGYYTGGLEVDHTYLDITDGQYVWGNDDGFKYTIDVSSTRWGAGGINYAQFIKGYLKYKGEQVSQAMIYSGYGEYEVGHLVIFTDEDYNLLIDTGNYAEGFMCLYNAFPGATVKNTIPVCGVFDGEFKTFTTGMEFDSTTNNIKDDIKTEIDPSTVPDPYDPDGDEGTEPGGGGGSHDLDSDDIDIPALPGLSAVDTGFITLFNPSLTELKALADYLWSPLFDIDTVKKLFADPMDVFLGLSIVPVAVPDGTPKTVKVAGISTGVTMTTAARQYVEVNCGSITVNEYWGAYLDYDPYTKAELYLPYVGVHPIAIDDIMGKTIAIRYHVDILSGACVAYVKCGASVLYTFIGQCSSSIPINRSDWTSVINGALTIATAIGTMVATGGASAPMASGSAGEAGAAAGASAAKEASKKAAMVRGVSEIASTAVNVMKPSIEKSGSISGTGGMMAIQKPYLILTRPRQAVPNNQKHYMGYPSFITTYISALSGYTEMEYVHLEGISATDEELSEIESLLKGGVYL